MGAIGRLELRARRSQLDRRLAQLETLQAFARFEHQSRDARRVPYLADVRRDRGRRLDADFPAAPLRHSREPPWRRQANGAATSMTTRAPAPRRSETLVASSGVNPWDQLWG